jgi:hypothetical protein
MVFWSALLSLSIAVVSFQVVRANNDDGLPLSAPSGTIARAAQLDYIEQQRQNHADQSYDVQQAANAQDDGIGLSHLAEVLDNASQ